MKPANRLAAAIHLESTKPAIMVMTETWLKTKRPELHEDYSCLQSPDADYQGVAIYFRKDISDSVTPLMTDQWSPGFVACRIKI